MTQTDTAVHDQLQAELLKLRENVAGVHGSMVATCDGFPITHDLPGLEPAQLAALAATARGLAVSSMRVTGRGEFRETLTHGALGYLAVYAAGDTAVLAVIGSTDLNVAMLQLRVREAAGKIAAYAAQFAGWAS